MLLQRVQSFQPRIPDIDLQFSRERIRAPGSPSSPEHTQLSQIVAEAEKDLSDYEEDLRCLDIVSDLRKKRDDLQTYVDDCKAYLSPIRQLPTEILGEIFLYYQDLHGTCKDGRFREPINDPVHSAQDLTALMLSSVSKLWHSICLCTPQLWSRFSLVLGPSKECNALAQLLPIYLSRSKQMPLCFDMYVKRRCLPASTKALSLLIAQSHRWFSTSWELCGMDEETVTCLGVQKDLPLLQYIAVSGYTIYANPFDIFAGACTPRTVSLEWIAFSDFLDSKFSWSEVHFLRASNLFGDVGVVEFLTKLAGLAGQCRALHSLEVQFEEEYHEPVQLECTIRLDTLEYLCLDKVSWYELFEFFSISTLPNLRRLALYITSGDEHTYLNSDSFRYFLSRSQCSISVLRLGALRLNALHPICDMLHHLPALKKLILAEDRSIRSAVTVMPSLMETLHVRSQSIEARQAADSLTAQNNDNVLPLLEELVMEVHAESFQASTFVDMVKSRRSLTSHGMGTLKSVRVRLYLQWSHSAKDFTLPPILQSLEGIDIEIISSTSDSRRFLNREHQECWLGP